MHLEVMSVNFTKEQKEEISDNALLYRETNYQNALLFTFIIIVNCRDEAMSQSGFKTNNGDIIRKVIIYSKCILDVYL
jgi:hypothetical protein